MQAAAARVARVVDEPPAITWLHAHLLACEMDLGDVRTCERILVQGEGYKLESTFAFLAPELFTNEYLAGLGITRRGIQSTLIRVHLQLRAYYTTVPDALLLPLVPGKASTQAQ